MSKSKAIIKMVSVILSVVILLTVLPLGVSAADTTPVTLNNSNDVTIQNLPADNSMLAGVDNIDTSLSEAEQLESLTELELSTIISNGKMERISADNVPAVVGFESAKLKNHVARAFEKEKDELNSLVFLNEDGTYTKYIYDYPVKYIDETGKVKDTSLDIVADTNGGYKTKQGNAVARFSEKIRDGITVSGNGVSVEMYPKLPTQVKAPVAIEKITKQPLQSLIQSTEKVNRLDNRTVSYYYDDKTTIEYNLTYLGIKEDIVVSEYTGQTDYYFTLKTGGLALTEIEDNYYLTDENGDVKATLGEVIIFTADEKNNAFGSMSAVTVKENEEYTVTIHVDADYLKDEKTVYPIRIDPTLEIDFDEDGNKLIQDLTINSNSTISHRTTESLRVGKNSDGTYSRILMKFNYDFGSFTDGPLKIHRAYIELRDVMCQTESMSVMSEMYIATNWSESSEWSTIARGTNTHYMATMPINYNKGNAFAVKHRYNISVLDAVKYWVAEANDTPNYEHELPHGGIMIRANDTVEQGDTIITKYFASSDYPTAEYRPSLAITYYDTHTQYSDPFGHLDAVASNSIRGWVWCVDLPNESIPVTLSLTNLTTGESFPGIDLNGEATALYRPDVHSAGYGTGCYGFNYAIDWNQYPAGKYSVTAKAHSMNGSGSQFPLFNGPLEYVNKGVLLDNNKLEIDVGNKKTLSVETIGVSTIGTMTWSSSNPHVATVSFDGIVTAYRAGMTVVTATDGTYSASCTVNCNQVLNYPDTLITDNTTRERIILLKNLIDENEIAYYKNQLTGLEMSKINKQLEEQANIIRADYITIGSNPTSGYAYEMLGGNIEDGECPLENRLTLGSEGFSVIVIQRALEVLGYYEPGTDDVYGEFGDNTVDAASVYAEDNELPSHLNGVFDDDFYDSLFSSGNIDLRTYEAYNQINKFKTAHNHVVMWTANKVSGTYNMSQNRIANGNNSGTYYGYADILKDTGDCTYIWEVKPNSEKYYKPDGIGEKQLNRYFDASKNYDQIFTRPLTIGYSVGQFSIPYIGGKFLNVESFHAPDSTDVRNALVLYEQSSVPQYALEKEYEEVHEPEKSYNFSRSYILNTIEYGTVILLGVVVIYGVVCLALAPSTGGASLIGLGLI